MSIRPDPAVIPALALLGALSLTPVYSAAASGPPWISIEVPANPYDQETRGALFVVRVFHHGEAAYYQLTGTAEGLVNGQRQTQQPKITATSKPGVYALRFQKPADGKWIVVLRVGDQDHGSATAVVTLGTDGQVTMVNVPTRQDGNWLIPRSVSAAEIDAMLQQS